MDQVPFSYQIQTLLGTAGNDLLVSSTDYGIIDALAGNDRIYGTEQAEVILPGFGSDEVFASGGADTITVVSFNDEIDGGTGSDTLSVEFANTNIEVIISLADGLIYNAQAAAIDRSTLSSIENVEINSDNSVTVFGTDTDNQITTASGNDTIHLGGGSNVVNSGAGSDHIYIAGSGNTANLGSGNDFVTTSSFDSAIDGGTGIDTLILSPIPSEHHLQSTLNFRHLQVRRPQEVLTFQISNSMNSPRQILLLYTEQSRGGIHTIKWGRNNLRWRRWRHFYWKRSFRQVCIFPKI